MSTKEANSGTLRSPPKGPLDNKKYNVGWICAVYKEYAAASAFLDEEHEGPAYVSEHDNNCYTLGKMGGHNVVIATMPDGEYGAASATSVARDMLHTFPNVRISLMVGIGGGAPSTRHDIRLGDIVVSSPRDGHGGVFQYDFGKTIQGQRFQETKFLSQPPAVLRAAVTSLRGHYEIHGHHIQEDIAANLGQKPRMRRNYGKPDASTDRFYASEAIHPLQNEGDCANVCGDAALVSRPTRQDDDDDPMIHYGLVASGNLLMRDALIRDQLTQEKDVLCFEMEAAGLMNHFPCLVIRGICDYSDSHKNDAWQGYAAMVAAAYAKDLLKRIPLNKVEAEKRLSEVIHAVEGKVDEIHGIATETKKTTEMLQTDYHIDRIKTWLAPPDPSTNLNRARSLHHQGTGQWFLDSDAYSRWRRVPRSFLWLYGIPGCGKTILSSTIITDLKSNSISTVLYFFFNFNDLTKRSLEKAMCSLIFQLYIKRPSLRIKVDSVYSRWDNGARSLDAASLEDLLQSMLHQLDDVFVVFDALDECERQAGSCSAKSLPGWIKNLQNTVANIHILVTGRPEQEIKAAFDGWTHSDNIIQLQSTLVRDDITAYVRAKTSLLQRWKQRPDIQAEIEAILLGKADGMFRWVACQFDTLEHCLDPPSVRRELQNLPLTLDETYNRILERIHPNQIRNTKRLLQFLIYSKRPLTLAEAIDIIAIDPSSTPAFIPENRMPIPEEITGYCSSLVALIHRDSTYENQSLDPKQIEIHLAHFSVKEYLTSNRLNPRLAAEFNEIPAKTCIVEACISYLRSIYHLCPPQRASEVYYLTKFSVYNWMWYARDVELSNEATIPCVEEYYLCQNVHKFWLQIHRGIHSLKKNLLSEPLSHASYYGLLHSSIFLLQNTTEMDKESKIYGNALLTASIEGYPEIVKIFLDHGVDANIRGPDHQFYGNAIQGAASTGHFEIVKILLDYGADVNRQFGNYGNALQAASSEGYTDIAKLLLDNGADANAQGGVHGNALCAASFRGCPEIVNMLLDNDADVNSKGDNFFLSGYSSPLHNAASQGHLEVIKILLDRGADIHARDTYGKDALGTASQEGHLEITEILLNRGARIFAEKTHTSPLYFASSSGHPKIIGLLLHNGADINAQGDASSLYCGALGAASGNGHLETVKMLLDNGADVNKQGGHYGNALCAASAKGRLEVVKMLLNYNADINMQSGDYGNALVAASAWGRLGVVRMLLENGADINVQNVHGGLYSSAIQAASDQGHSKVVKLLLDNGAKLNV